MINEKMGSMANTLSSELNFSGKNIASVPLSPVSLLLNATSGINGIPTTKHIIGLSGASLRPMGDYRTIILR